MSRLVQKLANVSLILALLAPSIAGAKVSVHLWVGHEAEAAHAFAGPDRSTQQWVEEPHGHHHEVPEPQQRHVARIDAKTPCAERTAHHELVPVPSRPTTSSGWNRTQHLGFERPPPGTSRAAPFDYSLCRLLL